MKYLLNDFNYCDFKTIGVNRMESRSYFIPFPDEASEAGVSLTKKRYSSKLVQVLNGIWDFKYYEDPKNVPNPLDTASIHFDKLEVPSCWQYKGYGNPCYLNVRYPFRFDPPNIPELEPVKKYWSLMDGYKRAPASEMNHVGVYRTFFAAPHVEEGKRYILSLLGVCSCADIYVNGKFVGYGEESHNTMEFDLTEYILKTTSAKPVNELLIVVHRWCNGSYLECQDMFRNTGIFRDVLLREEGYYAIHDLNLVVGKGDNGWNLVCLIQANSDCKISLRFEGHGINIKQITTADDNLAKVVLTNLDVHEWTAETPYLYDIYIETKEQFLHQRIGFDSARVEGDKFLFNGELIKLHGVNHHDTNPKTGYTMTAEEIERDLKLCKEFNVDCIRTSHYAPDPLLLELAAEMGIYIIDEVDIETHGAGIQKLPLSMNRISDNPEWMDHYLSRADHHYNRDKILATPIVMWSLGNEAGAGCNTNAMYDYFKSKSNIPVQYESALNKKEIIAYDVASQMYQQAANVALIGAKKFKQKKFMDRPYFLVEYAHAMGVGPGNIEDYWDAIYKYDSLLGGCIWEMNDHAVWHEDGSFTYGGDHGEWIHDKNFCCDGLFYPDRTPSTGAWIMKHCYSPLRLRLTGSKKLSILNTTGFTPGDHYKLDIRCSNGMHKEYVPCASPLNREITDFGWGEVKDELFIDIDVIEQKTGIIKDHTQFVINEKIQPAPKAGAALPTWFSVKHGRPQIHSEGISAAGALPYSLLYRAATDNDKKDFLFATMAPWYNEQEHLIGQTEENGKLIVKWKLRAAKAQFTVTDCYEGVIINSGKDVGVMLTTTLHCDRGRGYVPRFAKVLKLPESFNQIKWFGRKGESYKDMRYYTPVGEYQRGLLEMTEPNIKPQESGNRMDTRYVELSDGMHTLRVDALDKTFELGVKPYSDVELREMKHRSDEKVTGCYLALNAFQRGIGTGSCGPSVLERDQYSVKEDYTMTVLITVK